MSTFHKSAEMNTGEDQKPSMILDYNATKSEVGGTTCTESRGSTAPCERLSYNEFIIWTEIFPEWNMSLVAAHATTPTPHPPQVQ